MDQDKNGTATAEHMTAAEMKNTENGLHLAQRGEGVVGSDVDDDSIRGFEADRMKARTLLTAEKEKKVLRKIDWHIMPLCSLMFLFKNMDADNISNARIMNADTPQNIMVELGLSSNAYALLAVSY